MIAVLFNVIRIVLSIILYGLSVLITKNKFAKRGVITVQTVAFLVVLICGISLFPFENIFISFETAEDVFNYSRCGRITEIIHGDESCIIIYSKGNDTFDHYIVPKTDKGYKIPGFASVKTVSNKFDKDGLFNVYHVKGTDDYYVFWAIDLKKSENNIVVFPDEGAEIETEIYNVENSDFLYFFLKNYSTRCYLLINGQKVMISQ